MLWCWRAWTMVDIIPTPKNKIQTSPNKPQNLGRGGARPVGVKSSEGLRQAQARGLAGGLVAVCAHGRDGLRGGAGQRGGVIGGGARRYIILSTCVCSPTDTPPFRRLTPHGPLPPHPHIRTAPAASSRPSRARRWRCAITGTPLSRATPRPLSRYVRWLGWVARPRVRFWFIVGRLATRRSGGFLPQGALHPNQPPNTTNHPPLNQPTNQPTKLTPHHKQPSTHQPHPSGRRRLLLRPGGPVGGL